MSEQCGTVTEDGNAVCAPSASGEPCGCSSQAQIPVVQKKHLANNQQDMSLWRKIRSGVMFGIACVASPCCTPIIVPVAIALLSGTPAAIWLFANIGWVYGGLTLLSIISLVLGFRWMRQKSNHSVNAESNTGRQNVQEVNLL